METDGRRCCWRRFAVGVVCEAFGLAVRPSHYNPAATFSEYAPQLVMTGRAWSWTSLGHSD